MARRAVDGIQDLLYRTAGPPVKAEVLVDQPYAQDQHETLFYRHPNGGQAKFLEEPLFSGLAGRLQRFANGLLKPGADAVEGWADVARDVRDGVEENAPIEFGDLRKSAGLTVKEGSAVKVSEPPEQDRLGESELDAKDYMRAMGVGYRE